MAEYAIILVHTTSHAIQVERLMRGEQIEARLVPTPRHLSSDCGSAVRIPTVSIEQCEQLLRECGVSIDRIEVVG